MSARTAGVVAIPQNLLPSTTMRADDPHHVELGGIPETLLWTLYHRALEAGRPDAVLSDPLAVGLVERIDYPFAERFGGGALAQWQALRALRVRPGGRALPGRSSGRHRRRAGGGAGDPVLARATTGACAG